MPVFTYFMQVIMRGLSQILGLAIQENYVFKSLAALLLSLTLISIAFSADVEQLEWQVLDGRWCLPGGIQKACLPAAFEIQRTGRNYASFQTGPRGIEPRMFLEFQFLVGESAMEGDIRRHYEIVRTEQVKTTQFRVIEVVLNETTNSRFVGVEADFTEDFRIQLTGA